MFVSGKLTRIGAKNLYYCLRNYLDYEKLGITEDNYIDRLDFLYGWLYTKGVLVDEVVFSIVDIEKDLFDIFSSKTLLRKYKGYFHLLEEFEEISCFLADSFEIVGKPMQISEYLLEYFDTLIKIGGCENMKYHKMVIEEIRTDLLYSMGKVDSRSMR